MSRYLSIYFPNLLTDRLAIRKPELKDTCYVFTMSQKNRMMVTASSRQAEKQGIHVPMVLADAKALVPDILAFDEKIDFNQKLLFRIAKWAIRYSPNVAVELPDGIVLDSTGCAHLFGGEEKYLKNILSKLEQFGYYCLGGLSDSIGTSWAIARFGHKLPIIPSGQQYNALLNLPPVALRLTQPVIERLHKLGFDKIGKFIQMPASILRRRFGTEMLSRLGQALGTEEEAFTPIIFKAPYQERLVCLEPIKTRSAIEIGIEKLLELLCKRLSKEGQGIRLADLQCYRLDGKITEIQIGTNQSTHNIKHLTKLFGLKIDKIAPGLGIELLILTASKTEQVLIEQEKLWGGNFGLEDQNLAQLLDRLAGKVGHQAIKRYIPQAHYWPERSLRQAITLDEKTEIKWQKANPRPMEMLHKPAAIKVTAPIPDYPPLSFRYKEELHWVKKADGPERIEQEWWLSQGEHRDYYILEDDKGCRYWVFRSGHYNEDTSEWFLHGFFA